jgi:hypothetical protein
MNNGIKLLELISNKSSMSAFSDPKFDAINDSVEPLLQILIEESKKKHEVAIRSVGFEKRMKSAE